MRVFWNNYRISSSVISLDEFKESGDSIGILEKGEVNPSKHLVFLYNITTGVEYFYIKKQTTLANVTFGTFGGLPTITVNGMTIANTDQLFIVFDIDRSLPFNAPNKANQELELAALVALVAKDYATSAGLTALFNKLPAMGQALAVGSFPVVLTAIQQAVLTPPAAITGYATEATHLLIKAKTDNIPAQGQALAAASLPVVLTAIQVAALTPPAAITGYATEATHLLIKAKTDNIPAQGQALAAASLPVVLTSIQVAALTPPAAITGFALDTNVTALNTVHGVKTDAKSTATDATAVSIVSVLKQISASCQAPPSSAVTNAGTFAVQAVGSVADDATTPGAPQMVGGMAVETDGTDPTSVSAEADVAIFRTDRNRRLLVNDFHPNLWTANASYSAAQADVAIKATPGAGLCLYITDIIISNGATAGVVSLESDTGSAKTKFAGPLYLAANGGCVINFRTPVRLPANVNMGILSTTVTTHSITVNGFIAP